MGAHSEPPRSSFLSAAADPVIGELRRAHTPSGRERMPAHVTLLAPFIHASRLDTLDRHRLSDTVGRFPGFDLRLSAFGLFEDIDCLWLAPRPWEPFVEMTRALLDIYPEVDYPPEGASEIVPHVTIGSRLTRGAAGADQAGAGAAPPDPRTSRPRRSCSSVAPTGAGSTATASGSRL